MLRLGATAAALLECSLGYLFAVLHAAPTERLACTASTAPARQSRALGRAVHTARSAPAQAAAASSRLITQPYSIAGLLSATNVSQCASSQALLAHHASWLLPVPVFIGVRPLAGRPPSSTTSLTASPLTAIRTANFGAGSTKMLHSSDQHSQQHCSSTPLAVQTAGSSGSDVVEPACARVAHGQKLRVAAAVSGGVDSAVAASLLKQAGHDVFGIFMRNWDPQEEGLSGSGDLADLPAAHSPSSASSAHYPSTPEQSAPSTTLPASSATREPAYNPLSASNKGQLSCVDKEAAAAAAVCAALGIPFHEVDFVRQYWGQVFSEFVSIYGSGGTPNPDLACNRNIKFGELLLAAQQLGAEAVATGHYAQLRVMNNDDGVSGKTTKCSGETSGNADGGGSNSSSSSRSRVALLQGADPNKDQSYFLAAVHHAALKHFLFPIGHLQKSDVRVLAAQAGLQPLMAGRRSSRGICFVGKRRSFGAFMAQYVEPVPGTFLDVTSGCSLGFCSDILAFTPGQRARIPGSSKGAWYVAGKDMVSRTLFLAQGHVHPALMARTALLGQLSWLSGTTPPQLQVGRRHQSLMQLHSGMDASEEHDGVKDGEHESCRAEGHKGGEIDGKWVLQLQWEHAMRCQAKVRYRQPQLVPCWVVLAHWDKKWDGCVKSNGASNGSTWDGCVNSHEASNKSSNTASSILEAWRPRVVSPSRFHALLGDMAVTGPGHPLSSADKPNCDSGQDPTTEPPPQPPAAQKEQLVVVFDAPVRGLAPHQAVVLYELSCRDGSGTESGMESGIKGASLHCNRTEGTPHEHADGPCEGTNVCLGSATLLTPGKTVHEEQGV